MLTEAAAHVARSSAGKYIEVPLAPPPAPAPALPPLFFPWTILPAPEDHPIAALARQEARSCTGSFREAALPELHCYTRVHQLSSSTGGHRGPPRSDSSARAGLQFPPDNNQQLLRQIALQEAEELLRDSVQTLNHTPGLKRSQKKAPPRSQEAQTPPRSDRAAARQLPERDGRSSRAASPARQSGEGASLGERQSARQSARSAGDDRSAPRGAGGELAKLLQEGAVPPHSGARSTAAGGVQERGPPVDSARKSSRSASAVDEAARKHGGEELTPRQRKRNKVKGNLVGAPELVLPPELLAASGHLPTDFARFWASELHLARSFAGSPADLRAAIRKLAGMMGYLPAASLVHLLSAASAASKQFPTELGALPGEVQADLAPYAQGAASRLLPDQVHRLATLPDMSTNFAAAVLPPAALAMSRRLHETHLRVSCEVAWQLHLRGVSADMFFERLAARIEDEPVTKCDHVSSLALAMFACHRAGALSHGRARKMYEALAQPSLVGQLSGDALACLSRFAQAREAGGGAAQPGRDVLATWVSIWRRHVRAMQPANLAHVVKVCGQQQLPDHVLFAEAALRMAREPSAFAADAPVDLLQAAAAAKLRNHMREAGEELPGASVVPAHVHHAAVRFALERLAEGVALPDAWGADAEGGRGAGHVARCEKHVQLLWAVGSLGLRAPTLVDQCLVSIQRYAPLNGLLDTPLVLLVAALRDLRLPRPDLLTNVLHIREARIATTPPPAIVAFLLAAGDLGVLSDHPSAWRRLVAAVCDAGAVGLLPDSILPEFARAAATLGLIQRDSGLLRALQQRLAVVTPASFAPVQLGALWEAHVVAGPSTIAVQPPDALITAREWALPDHEVDAERGLAGDVGAAWSGAATLAPPLEINGAAGVAGDGPQESVENGKGVGSLFGKTLGRVLSRQYSGGAAWGVDHLGAEDPAVHGGGDDPRVGRVGEGGIEARSAERLRRCEAHLERQKLGGRHTAMGELPVPSLGGQSIARQPPAYEGQPSTHVETCKVPGGTHVALSATPEWRFEVGVGATWREVCVPYRDGGARVGPGTSGDAAFGAGNQKGEECEGGQQTSRGGRGTGLWSQNLTATGQLHSKVGRRCLSTGTPVDTDWVASLAHECGEDAARKVAADLYATELLPPGLLQTAQRAHSDALHRRSARVREEVAAGQQPPPMTPEPPPPEPGEGDLYAEHVLGPILGTTLATSPAPKEKATQQRRFGSPQLSAVSHALLTEQQYNTLRKTDVSDPYVNLLSEAISCLHGSPLSTPTAWAVLGAPIDRMTAWMTKCDDVRSALGAADAKLGGVQQGRQQADVSGWGALGAGSGEAGRQWLEVMGWAVGPLPYGELSVSEVATLRSVGSAIHALQADPAGYKGQLGRVGVGRSTVDDAAQMDLAVEWGSAYVAVNVFPPEEFESVYPYKPLGRVQSLERVLHRRGWVPLSLGPHSVAALVPDGPSSLAGMLQEAVGRRASIDQSIRDAAAHRT